MSVGNKENRKGADKFEKTSPDAGEARLRDAIAFSPWAMVLSSEYVS